MSKSPAIIPISDKEQCYLEKEYAKIDYSLPSMQSFLAEIYETLRRTISLDKNASVLDIGCGKGYFLKYLQDKGFDHIAGVDPCNTLLKNSLVDKIQYGGYESNPYKDNEFDIVITSHTLHHLPDKSPINAIKEMLRITRKYIVIVEINNTNLPVLMITLLMKKVEQNAFRYNRTKVIDLVKQAGAKVLYAEDMRSCYLSGDSMFYRMLASMGKRPYNILIAKKMLES